MEFLVKELLAVLVVHYVCQSLSSRSFIYLDLCNLQTIATDFLNYLWHIQKFTFRQISNSRPLLSMQNIKIVWIVIAHMTV